MSKRFLPLLAIIAVALALYASGLHRQLSLAALRDHEPELRAFVDAHYFVAVAAFVALSATVIAASVPVGIFLTVAGGFILGPWVAGAALSFAATLGAIGSYVAVRSAFGDSLRRRAERKDGVLGKVMDELTRHTFSTVFSLRLIPLAPFWLVNVASALANAPLRAYALATLIGIMPATFIYSSVGAGIGQVLARGGEPNLKIIFEPYVIGPLVALGLLSLGTTVFQRLRTRKGPAS